MVMRNKCEHMLRIKLMSTSCEITCRWMQQNTFDESTLAQVMEAIICWPVLNRHRASVGQNVFLFFFFNTNRDFLWFIQQCVPYSLPSRYLTHAHWSLIGHHSEKNHQLFKSKLSFILPIQLFPAWLLLSYCPRKYVSTFQILGRRVYRKQAKLVNIVSVDRPTNGFRHSADTMLTQNSTFSWNVNFATNDFKAHLSDGRRFSITVTS